MTTKPDRWGLTPPQRRFLEALDAHGGFLWHLHRGQHRMTIPLMARGYAEWHPGNPPAFFITDAGRRALRREGP